MSYILDALRRADAERERGAVPDLHARPMTAAVGDGEPLPASGRWPAIAMGLALLLLLVLGWQWWGSEPAPPPSAAAPVVLAPPAAPPPVAQASAMPRAAESVSLPLPPEQPLRLPAPAPVAKAPTEAARPAAAASAAAPAERLYALHELPEAIRQTLPRLVIGGSVYSSNPAARVLIINGQVFQQGGQPAPELVLEQIGLKSAVMRYKGYRYEIGY